MFIVKVGLYKEPEFARTKVHQKLKQKHTIYLENTKIVQSVLAEVLFVLDSKKTQVEKVFPIEISVFSAVQLSDTGRPTRQIVDYGGKWPQETCAGCPQQRYATGEPGKFQGRHRVGIVEGSYGYRARGVNTRGKFDLSSPRG